MQFTPMAQLEDRTAAPSILSVYDKAMALPLTEENVGSMDYGFWGIKGFGKNAPKGVTFQTVRGDRIAEETLDNLLFTTNRSSDIGLVNPITGTDVLFGMAALNSALPNSIQRKDGTDESSYQAFLMAALSRIVRPGISRLWLVVGLTVDDMRNNYFITKIINDSKGLFQFTTIHGDKFSVLVERVSLQPQPAGALFDMVIDGEGMPSDQMEVIRTEPSAVIATGGETAEVYVTRPVKDDDGQWRMQVHEARCGSRFGAGVRGTVHRYLTAALWSDIDHRQRPNDIDAIIQRGFWWNGHEDVDITEIVEKGRSIMVDQVMELIKATIGLDNSDLRYIALAGGSIRYVQNDLVKLFGAHRTFLPGQRPGLSDEQNAKLAAQMSNPERVIARGLHRYGRYQLRRWLASNGG